MKIRLDQVEETYAWQETVEVSTAELDLPELVELGKIEWRGRLRRMAESFLLQATVSYEQRLRCMRCLSPVDLPVSNDLNLILEVGGHEDPGRERELESEDLGLMLLEEGILDTRPILMEQVQLNVPMKPLCKEDCAGLCSRCGADLNAGPCDCDRVADPRWAALAALRKSS